MCILNLLLICIVHSSTNLLKPIPLTLTTFFLLQLDKLTSKYGTHATGPKKPNLTQTELEKKVK